MQERLIGFECDTAAPCAEHGTSYWLSTSRRRPTLRAHPDAAAHALSSAYDPARAPKALDEFLFVHVIDVGATGIDCHGLNQGRLGGRRANARQLRNNQMTTMVTISPINNQPGGSSYFTVDSETVLPTRREKSRVALVEGPLAEVQGAHDALQAILDAGGTVTR